MRNIIYLDVEKMYSLSSQIFEGVTEYIVSENSKTSEESENQKGPVGSGKVLGDILRNEERVSEKRFLVDHSYVLFENKLKEDGRVATMSEAQPNDELKLNAFVKITGKLIFNDMVSIKNMIKNFNSTGKSIASVTTAGLLDNLKKELTAMQPGARRKEIESQIRTLSNPDLVAKTSGMYQEPSFLANLVSVLDYGFQDQLEVKLKIGDKIFSADLKRECLREREDLLIRKYSRQSEVEFIIFGIVTQLDHSGMVEPEVLSDTPKIKEAIMSLVSHMTNVERTFIGRLDNEVIIDPIAIYSYIQ